MLLSVPVRRGPHMYHKEWSGPKCPQCWGWETLAGGLCWKTGRQNRLEVCLLSCLVAWSYQPEHPQVTSSCDLNMMAGFQKWELRERAESKCMWIRWKSCLLSPSLPLSHVLLVEEATKSHLGSRGGEIDSTSLWELAVFCRIMQNWKYCGGCFWKT